MMDSLLGRCRFFALPHWCLLVRTHLVALSLQRRIRISSRMVMDGMPGTNHIPADSTALFNLFASFSESTLSTMYRFGIFTIVLVLLDCNTSVIRHSDDKHSIAHSLDSIGLPASVRQNATVCLPGVQVLYPLVPARSSPQNAGVQHRTLGESVPPVSFSRRPRFAAGVMKRDIERRNELRKTKDNIWFHSKIN